MKYRVLIEIDDHSEIEKLHTYMSKTYRFNKKFYTWTLTREHYEYPVVRIRAIAISRDLNIELLWLITCNRDDRTKDVGSYVPYNTYDLPLDNVIPFEYSELQALYPRREESDCPWMNVFELNDFLDSDDITIIPDSFLQRE